MRFYKQELMILIVAMSILGGFLSGIFIWNATREYEPTPVIAEATLVSPYIDFQWNTPVPTVPPTPEATAEPLQARLSWYWPPNLGPNCHPENIVDGKCESWLTDGTRWYHWSWWYDNVKTVACPREFPLGTKFFIPALNNTYLCIDRGGAIETLDDSFFLDILQPDPIWVENGKIIRDEYSPSSSYIVDVIIVE